MRTWTTLLISAAALILSACGPAPLGRPPLWRIADADSEIWLFGSVHVLPDDVAWRSEAFEAAFAEADELVTEADVSDAAATAALASHYGALPSGERLSDKLPPRARIQLARVVSALGADAEAIEMMRPWLAGLRLSYLFARSRGQESDAGVEAALMPEARARGMALSYLETPEQQVRTLADLSDADQMNFLQSTLDEIERSDDVLERTQSAWADGDVARLERLLHTQLHAAGDGPYSALIPQRNRAWAAQIEHRLEGSGRTIYVVGVAHLLGDDSVVALLRADGIAVDGP